MAARSAGFLAFGLILLLAGAVRAADIPSTPFLRIETGMHGAAINGLAVDAADKELVTVSDDKTARLWSTADGSLVETMRGPIGPGPEGGLYAVALSPTGKTIAVGGYTGITWDGSAGLYLFNRVGGTWLGRIALGAGADTITHLAFSPDGHYLAVGTTDGHGLRVVDTHALTVKIVDPDYTDAIEWVDFAPDGRLVTSSLDGMVRLYSPALSRIATYRVPDRHKPYAVAFDKDGAKVAVGLLDAASVLILSAHDLKREGEREGAPHQTGALSVLAWSADGTSLYAGGTYGDPSGQKLVRVWRGTAATASDIPVSDDTVTALAALDDGVACASTEPAWAKIAGSGEIEFRHDRTYADFRDGEDAFAVSPDGAAVSFGFAQGGKSVARIDILAGTVEMNPPPRADMKAPATSDAGATVTDWRNGVKPKLDGHVLTLDANETARSAAVLADKALIGTDFFLRAYAGGQAAWRTAVPAPAWVVNLTADGRLAVAGLGDGTVRWYRMSDGAEILSAFAEPDGKHWVAWTPEGFFDHGEGGEQLIGYHLNRIADGRPKGADFVRVEQLYALFFRRDLVVKKFQGKSEDEIAQQLQKIGDVRDVLGKGLPPDLRLTEYCLGSACQPVAPAEQVRGVGKVQLVDTSAPEVTLHFDVADRGGGIGPIVVRDKGATLAAPGGTRSINGNVHNEERVVPLEPGANIIMLSAFNGAKQIETGFKDRPLLALKYDVTVNTKPVMRLLAVGIDKYTGRDIPPLANASADAKGVADVMRGDGKHDVYSDVDAIVLTDADASLANIDKAFADLAGRTKPDDLVFVFLAGHGVALDGKYYYVPADVPDAKDASIRAHALTYDDLAARLAKFPTARAIVVLDTCYSGAFAVQDSIQRDSQDQTVGKQISHETGRFILAGSSSEQEALDGVDGHGVFTETLLKGLAGGADQQDAGNHDGKVTIFELGEYTKAEVPKLAAAIAKGYNQKPRWYFNGDDMFVVRDDN